MWSHVVSHLYLTPISGWSEQWWREIGISEMEGSEGSCRRLALEHLEAVVDHHRTISSTCTKLSLPHVPNYLNLINISILCFKLSLPEVPNCLNQQYQSVCTTCAKLSNYLQITNVKKTVTGIAPSHHPTVQHATLLFSDKTRYLETYHFIAIQCNPLDFFCHVCHQCQEQNTEKDYDKKIRNELTIIIPDDDHGNRDGDDDNEIGR